MISRRIIFAQLARHFSAAEKGIMQKESVVAGLENPTSKRKVFDPAYAILVVAIVLTLTYAVKVSREKAVLQARAQEYSGTLCGPQTIQEGDIVAAFEATDLQGQWRKIAYGGTKRALFFIFSPMCSTCEHEIPLWNSLAEIAASKTLTVQGISIDSLEDSRKNAVGKHISFDMLIMPDMPTRRAYRVVSIPQVILVSGHGTVEWVHYGRMTQNKLAELQAKLRDEG